MCNCFESTYLDRKKIGNQMIKIVTVATACTVLTASIAHADEEYKHFPSIASPNTSVALCNLAKFNEKLKTIANKDTLTPEDMVKVHELTYTLESAVQRLQKDLETVAVDLEKVHKASERLDDKVVEGAGKKYLTATGLFTNQVACK